MIEALLTGGGAGGLIVALAYTYRQIVASRRERRVEPTEQHTAAMTNAETANTMLLSALREEREEVTRLSGRVQQLEDQNATLYERLREQRQAYEREIESLKSQLTEFAAQLEDLQTRLREST